MGGGGGRNAGGGACRKSYKNEKDEWRELWKVKYIIVCFTKVFNIVIKSCAITLTFHYWLLLFFNGNILKIRYCLYFWPFFISQIVLLKIVKI